MGWLRNAFVNAGKMALTNYLLQSLIAAMIFHGYGLGLIDQLSIAQVLSLAILIFSMQLLLSTCWMTQFRYGPIEYILRAITILQWPNQILTMESNFKKTN